MAKGQFVNRVTKSTAVLNRIRKALPENTRDLVVGMATGVEDEYRATAPRDTGAMAESAYTQLQEGAYQHGVKTSVTAVEEQALALNATAQIAPLPTPTNATTAYVAPITGYWIHDNFGTRYRAGTGTLSRARAKVQSELKTKYKDLFVKVATDGAK